MGESNEYKKYDSEELLVILSMAEDDEEEAKRAFYELVERHKEELLRYCTTMCNTEANPNKFQVIFDPNDAIEIVWNAFYRIKSNPNNFDMAKANTEDVEKAVGAYLKGTVKTEFKKKYFGTDEEIKIEHEYEVDLSEDGKLIPTRAILKGMTKEIEEALMGLTVKEREVFIAYAEFCPNGEYIPREIASLLRDKLDLGESSLRVYNGRAKKKIQERLSIINRNGK